MTGKSKELGVDQEGSTARTEAPPQIIVLRAAIALLHEGGFPDAATYLENQFGIATRISDGGDFTEWPGGIEGDDDPQVEQEGRVE
jgi:hypothetical protein